MKGYERFKSNTTCVCIHSQHAALLECQNSQQQLLRTAKLHKYKCDILIIKFNEKNKGMDKGNVFKTIFTKLDIRYM